MCFKNILMLFLLTISFAITSTTHSFMSYMFVCEDFGPSALQNCGTSINNHGGYWEGHLKQTLPKVAASAELLSDYVLYFGAESMGKGVRSAQANYQLTQPGSEQAFKGVDMLCVRFEAIKSDPCLENNMYTCLNNVILTDTKGSPIVANDAFEYLIEDWTISNYEFNLSSLTNYNHSIRHVLIQGDIEITQLASLDDPSSPNYVPLADRFPYIAIRKIVASTGSCPRRIGRRGKL